MSKNMCDYCLGNVGEQYLFDCIECGASVCTYCLESGMCPDCREKDVCDCCGCGVDELIECEECCAMVGPCCWDQIEGKCVICVDR